MLKTETYYLIDFENVNESGLSNIENLTVHDHIHIFSTENAPKISFHTLVAFNKIDFNSHIVPTGNQSLDMHLIAYLGYLIGKNQSNNCKYVIISKDTDYDHSISFLKKIANVKICRQTSLCLTSKTKNSALKKRRPQHNWIQKLNLTQKSNVPSAMLPMIIRRFPMLRFWYAKNTDAQMPNRQFTLRL